MASRMEGLRLQDFQIIWMVVPKIAVLVVNYLAVAKRAPYFLFGDLPMEMAPEVFLIRGRLQISSIRLSHARKHPPLGLSCDV